MEKQATFKHSLLANGHVPIAIGIGSGKELVAYLVAHTDQNLPNVAEIRAFLDESLPDYMVPSHYVELDELPLTNSGKVNRKALPKPEKSTIQTGTTYVAPRNEVEEKLATVWQNVLNKETISIYDNFFHLGGHSLRAIRMISIIEQQFNTKISLSQIFEQPSFAALAIKIEEQQNQQLLQNVFVSNGNGNGHATEDEMEEELMEDGEL